MEQQQGLKVVDRRGEDREWPTEQPAALPGTPTADGSAAPPSKPVVVFARQDDVRTTSFVWVCPKCSKEQRLIHLLLPKETEAVGSGGSTAYTCECGTEIEVKRQVVAGAKMLPGLPINRKQRRAMASR